MKDPLTLDLFPVPGFAALPRSWPTTDLPSFP